MIWRFFYPSGAAGDKTASPTFRRAAKTKAKKLPAIKGDSHRRVRLLVSLNAVLSTVFQGRMDHVPSPFGVSVLW